MNAIRRWNRSLQPSLALDEGFWFLPRLDGKKNLPFPPAVKLEGKGLGDGLSLLNGVSRTVSNLRGRCRRQFAVVSRRGP